MANRSNTQGKCCICYAQNCSESIDHYPLTFSDLKTIIESSKRNREPIDALKFAAKEAYNTIKRDFIMKVEKDQKIFQEWLNQFYFAHLAEKINKPFLCQLAEDNFSQLPTKSLSKLIRALKNPPRADLVTDLPSAFQDAKRFIDRLDADNITERPMRLLGVERVVKSAQASLLSLSSKRSLSQIYNPEEFEAFPQVYEWRNVKLNRNSRTVQLSNKNLKDQDLISELPRISSFKNLREFEIRNNFITALSCKLIVNNLSFIQCLDIRGNRVGDTGLEHIIKGMSHLKNLLISETGATDRTGRLIAEKMDSLELFWAQHNHLSGEVILAIGSKPKVKVMSVAGNPIEKKYSSILHSLFIRKGYIVL